MSEAGTEHRRMIELGPLRIHLGEGDDAIAMVQSLARRLSNQEAAEILGVSERTVRRWKRAGKLPGGDNSRLKLADLLLMPSKGTNDSKS